MSLNAFATGLSGGLESGIKLGLAYNKGQDVRGVREANALLAQMEGMGPVPVTPGNQGALPDPNAPQQTAPTGYDGVEWSEMKSQYMAALRGVTDAQTLQLMEKRLVDMEKNKVLSYGNAALAAMDEGDLEKAQQYLAGVSYFMFPGETPVVQVGQDGTVFFRDDEGQGMALNKEQLADVMHRFTNFEGWRELTFDRERHADDMAYRNAVLAAQVAQDAANLAIDQEELALKREENALQVEKLDVETEALRAAAKREEEKYLAGLEAAEAEAYKTFRDESQQQFDALVADPAALTETLKGTAPMDESSGEAIPEDPAVTQARANAVIPEIAESERKTRRANLRWILDADPKKRDIASTLLTGLVKGGDFSASQDLANAVFGFIFQTPEKQDYFYDPDNGVLRVGQPGNQISYSIGAAEQQALNALMGVKPSDLMAADQRMAEARSDQYPIPMEGAR